MTNRRKFLLGLAVAPTLLARPSLAQGTKPARFLFATPLSGGMARNGEYCRKGIELAVEDINNAGGIKALGGIPLEFTLVDVGDSVERAKASVERAISTDPSLIAGVGAWASALTLAATEASERAKLPWISDGWAEPITGRGFKYIVDPSPPAGRITDAGLQSVLELSEKTTGKKPTRVGIIADTAATSVAIMAQLRANPAKYGLTIVVDESFTFPMSDATPIAQAVRRARPDFLVVSASILSDAKLLIDKLAEFDLGYGKLLIVSFGPQLGSVDTLKNIGADKLEGLIGCIHHWESSKDVQFIKSMRERTKEPWLTSDPLINYAYVMLLKDALERVGSTDREKLMAALRATDTDKGPAHYFLGTHLKFDNTGRRIDAPVALFQWQNGVPVTVYPASDAQAPLKWPRRQG